MDLFEALENLKFDRRMADWNVRQGLLKPDEFESHLQSLPDSASLSETLTLDDREEQGGSGQPA